MLNSCSLTLTDLEAKIEQGLQGFYEVGQALVQIRNRKLYLAVHSSFEAYCQERWSMGKAYAYRLMSASQTVEGLPSGDRPESEWQVRHLAQLEPIQLARAWAAAQELGGAQPNAPIVERAARAVKADAQWQPGQRVQGVDGGILTVERIDGVIVHATAADGQSSPFLSNELQAEGSAPVTPANLVERAWTAQGNKTDRLEALEAELQLEQTRCKMLEAVISRMLRAFDVGWIDPDLASEARALLA